jgi:hypothetical protein
MEKITESKREIIKNIAIYRDDLEEIYTIFKENSDKVIFRIDNFLLDSSSEIPQINQDQANDIKFNISNPTFDLELNNEGAKLYINTPDTRSDGLYAQIKILLEKRKMKFPVIGRFIGILLTIYAFVTIFLVDIFYKSITIQINPIIGWIIFAFTMLSLFLGPILYFKFNYGNHSRINLRYHKEMPSFLRRKKDDIILGIILLIIGFIAGNFVPKIW